MFYANRCCGEIHTIDLIPSPPVVNVIFSVVPRILTHSSYILRAPWGDLLMVLLRYGLRPLDTTSGNTQESELSSDDEGALIPRGIPIKVKVTVHKVNLAERKLTEIKNLQGHAIFIGFNHAFMVNAYNHANLSPNCVYVSDDNKDRIYGHPFEERQLTRLNLEDASLKDVHC